jgi:hypothetical protein
LIAKLVQAKRKRNKKEKLLPKDGKKIGKDLKIDFYNFKMTKLKKLLEKWV